MTKRFSLKRISLGLLIVIAAGLMAAGVFGYRYVNSAASGQAVAIAAMASPHVSEIDGVITVSPAEQPNGAGIVFYQGGLVEADAYAPLALELAAAGYHVFIPRMPFNLAVLSPNLADEIIASRPDITTWAIGGHSLGAGMASVFTIENPDSVQALFLYGFYPSDATDMAGLTLPVLSVYGTLDGLATVEEMFASEAMAFYPDTVEFVAIEGGNHAQFGDYGEQEGDLVATISAEDQRQQTIDATLRFLRDSLEYVPQVR